jgi:hypothetical protein
VNIGALRVLLLIGGVLGLIALVRVVAWPLAPIELHASVDATAAPLPRPAVSAAQAESVSAIVARDPFRIGRLPAITAYDPVRLAQPVVPPPPRPQLILVGIVSGTDASAVVEGLPGVEGSRVVRVGDVVAGLQIKQIGTNRVVIAGMDTTWVLEVREPWKN